MPASRLPQTETRYFGGAPLHADARAFYSIDIICLYQPYFSKPAATLLQILRAPQEVNE